MPTNSFLISIQTSFETLVWNKRNIAQSNPALFLYQRNIQKLRKSLLHTKIKDKFLLIKDKKSKKTPLQ